MTNAAQHRVLAAEKTNVEFPVAAFLVVAGPRFLMDYTRLAIGATCTFQQQCLACRIFSAGTYQHMYVPAHVRSSSSGTVEACLACRIFSRSCRRGGGFPELLRAPGTPLGEANFDGGMYSHASGAGCRCQSIGRVGLQGWIGRLDWKEDLPREP